MKNVIIQMNPSFNGKATAKKTRLMLSAKAIANKCTKIVKNCFFYMYKY